jgi:hypothetical protein
LANGKVPPACRTSEKLLLGVEGLNDARTLLAGFFSILLVSTLGFQRGRGQIPIETMKLFCRKIFILESGESGLIDGIFDRVVKIR